MALNKFSGDHSICTSFGQCPENSGQQIDALKWLAPSLQCQAHHDRAAVLTLAALPDPRRYPGAEGSSLAGDAQRLVSAGTGSPLTLEALAREVAAMLARGEETTVRNALRQAPSADACRALYQALDLALKPGVPGREDAAGNSVNLHLFAIPVLLVVGAPAAHRVSGVLPDPESVCTLFEKSGVLGHCRNFGVSSALAALEQLEALPWATLYSVANAQSWADYAGLDLAPADIDIPAERETVHLRFISGAAMTPADAPAFIEAAGDIGRWGIPLTKELGRQMSVAEVSLLAIPRAPRSIVRAMLEGWFAARELGFQLFLSNALRQARTRIGEPDVTVAAYSDQTIRIRLTSPFDELLDQVYGWPLSPADDFEAVAGSISAMLHESRVERFVVAPVVENVLDGRAGSH